MSLSDFSQLLFPNWLQDWIRYELLPKLGLTPHQFASGLLSGFIDTILFVFMALGLLSGGRTYMAQQYTLPEHIQATTLQWAATADKIARDVDIPREVPLVLWFKESGMEAVNPDLCTGIIGAYDLVRSGERPCFEPGPITKIEVAEQLRIGAEEFKKRCADITYYTIDAEIIKRCYFAYNAGVGASQRYDADTSAYVMNNYSADHRNMIYSDIVLGTVQMEQTGAWPTHLAMQSLITGALDEANGEIFSIAFLDMSTRLYDWLNYRFINNIYDNDAQMGFPTTRTLNNEKCIGAPHFLGDPDLRPALNPIFEMPLLTQDVHGCQYALPGIDISSDNRSAVIQAPMQGHVTTYTDQWYNTTIRIENEEWVVLMLHPRSYLVSDGEVERGQAVGIMGAIGNATGPHVHYTIYDKVNETFVDPARFLP